MSSEDLEAFAHLHEVANAWIYVAGGAFLIAVKETWDLHESYEWGEWTFWALILAMVVLVFVATFERIRRRRRVLDRN